MSKTKKTIKLILKANTLQAKAIATLDSDWEYIKAQQNLIELLYEYHSLIEELIDKIQDYRKECQRLNDQFSKSAK